MSLQDGSRVYLIVETVFGNLFLFDVLPFCLFCVLFRSAAFRAIRDNIGLRTHFFMDIVFCFGYTLAFFSGMFDFCILL